jgi:hypothetical protein
MRPLIRIIADVADGTENQEDFMRTDAMTLDDLFEVAVDVEFAGFDREQVVALKPLYIAVIKRTWDEADAIDTVKFVLRLKNPLESQRRAS